MTLRNGLKILTHLQPEPSALDNKKSIHLDALFIYLFNPGRKAFHQLDR